MGNNFQLSPYRTINSDCSVQCLYSITPSPVKLKLCFQRIRTTVIIHNMMRNAQFWIRISSVTLLALLAVLIVVQPVTANHNYKGLNSSIVKPLCLPNKDIFSLDECLNLGPALYLSHMASLGITFPPLPLPAQKADPDLVAVNHSYAKVVTDNAPVFASIEAAIQGSPILRKIEAGFDFITYTDVVEIGGKKYYMIDTGIWMRGADLSRIGSPGAFQGLVFRDTPKVRFGWIRNQTEIKRKPGYQASDYTGTILYRYDVVQIYDIEKMDGMEWYLVGPEQWVEGRQVSRVIPNPTPPQDFDIARWIEVNLAEQTLAVYDQEKLVFATLIATGREGAWTQPGLFNIYSKKEAETMQGSFTADRSDYYYLEDVPWTMYFDQARALHGTYWHNRFGYPQSRGCVNLSTGDANWLFSWAKEGDYVYVWDPSGKTPTDPNLYGVGGV